MSTCALFDIDEDGEVVEAIVVDEGALSPLAVLVVLRDVMQQSLGVVLGIDRRPGHNWGMAGGWAFRELESRFEVRRHGAEPVSGAMSWTDLDDLLGADLAEVRAWAEGIDETERSGYWARSRPVEFERASVPWSADEWWRDVEGERYPERVAAWSTFTEVLTAHIDRIEAESGTFAPGITPSPLLACESCGQVCNGFTLSLNHGGGPRPRLHGRDELLCASLATRINRASVYIKQRPTRWARMVDGEIVEEARRPTPEWDEPLLELADYGWTFAPDGTPISPRGWPKAVAA